VAASQKMIPIIRKAVDPMYSGGTLGSGEYTKPIVMWKIERKEWIDSGLT